MHKPLNMFRKLCAYVPLRLCASPKSAFSLIELLVAMSVTIVIVFMVTNMFRNASEAWDTGTQRAQMNTAARAAMDLIARELSCAMAGSIPGVPTLREFDLSANELSFVALSGENQAFRGIRFRHISANRTIDADFITNNFQPYASGWPAWNPQPQLLISNVWRFELSAYSNANDVTAGNSMTEYDSSQSGDALPACVDIALEMLSGRDMLRAMSLNGPDDDPNSPRYGFVMTNSRIYSARVWLGNRGGR